MGELPPVHQCIGCQIDPTIVVPPVRRCRQSAPSIDCPDLRIGLCDPSPFLSAFANKTQQCYVHITCPKSEVALSLHKTFTDCYFAEGFAGGYWATALNDENMNYYYLGWTTREVLKFAYPTRLLADLLHLLLSHSCIKHIQKPSSLR